MVYLAMEWWFSMIFHGELLNNQMVMCKKKCVQYLIIYTYMINYYNIWSRSPVPNPPSSPTGMVPTPWPRIFHVHGIYSILDAKPHISMVFAPVWMENLIFPWYVQHFGCKTSYFHTNIPTYLYKYIPTYLHIYMHTYLRTYVPTYLQTYIPTYLSTYIHTYITLHNLT